MSSTNNTAANNANASPYQIMKQRVTTVIQLVMNDFKRIHLDKSAQQCRDLRTKLAAKQQKSAHRPPYDLDALAAGSSYYELTSAVFHTGDARSGHYYASCALG